MYSFKEINQATHLLNTHNNQDYTKPKSEGWNSIWIGRTGGRDPSTKHWSYYLLPPRWQQQDVGSEAELGILPDPPYGMWVSKLCLLSYAKLLPWHLLFKNWTYWRTGRKKRENVRRRKMEWRERWKWGRRTRRSQYLATKLWSGRCSSVSNHTRDTLDTASHTFSLVTPQLCS